MLSVPSVWAVAPEGLKTNRRTTRRVILAVLAAAVAASWLLLEPLAPRGSAVTPAPAPVSARPPALDPGLSTSGHRPQSVVIQAAPGQLAAVRATVRAAGGRVGAALGIINGFAAVLPASSLSAVASAPGVVSVTANRTGRFDGLPSGDADPSPGSTASEFIASTGADQAWSQGDYGQGIGVALVDTGVSPMDDLVGHVIWGPDFSGDNSLIDEYGHGTVMAGLIAGDGADSAGNPGGAYDGMAPRATVIAVKVSGASGAVDVSTILEALSWVSANASQLDIRVLNLSLGFPSTQSPLIDPLNYAVERLWHQGIVVVVAAGNGGPDPGTITKPGDDPDVITVGAYDDRNDDIPAWSSVGPTELGLAKPDIVAPGRTVVATRSFGSTVEQDNPQALIPPSYIVGSGTSEATAITSGAVALLLEQRPGLTPDQVKYLLKSDAQPLVGYTPDEEGSGLLDVGAALSSSAAGASAQTFQGSGLGSLDASRGGLDVEGLCNGQDVVLTGDETAQCTTWDPSSFVSSWTGGSWTGGSWTGGSWTGGSWTGGSWTGGSWTGGSWTGGSWTGGSWTGGSWTAEDWTGGSWTGASYGDMMTAFWGWEPPPGRSVNGEPYTALGVPAAGTETG